MKESNLISYVFTSDNKEVKKIDGPTELKSNLSTLKVNRLELWKISNNRREILIQTYPLKHF